MSRAVHFERIGIDRARGIRRGEGFTLAELCAGVNLVSGSNGSGKSTTALAMQDVLWPQSMVLPRPTISATLADGTTNWRIDIEAGHVTATRDGIESAPPSFAPAESRSHHRLALDDLIVGDASDFARHIANAARGGFDLTSAASALGFTASPAQPRRVANAVDDTRRHLRDAQLTQERLVERERELERLRRRLEEARSSAKELATLERARQWHEADRHCRELDAQIAAFPPTVERLRGDERERLKDLDRRRDETASELEQERERLASAIETMAAARMPEEGAADTELGRLPEQVEALKGLEDQLRTRQRLVADADGRIEEIRRLIGPEVDDTALLAVDRGIRRELADHVARRVAHEAAEATLRERRRSLSLGEPHDTNAADGQHDADTLKGGIRTLVDWARAPSPISAPVAPTASAPAPIPALVAAIVVALLCVVLAIVHHWLWLFGVAIAVALGLWARRASATPPDAATTADERAVHRKGYERLGLAAPSSWDGEGVADRIATLQRELETRIRLDRRISDLASLEAEEAEHASAGERLETERDELSRRLGLPIGNDARWLETFVVRVGEWQKARVERAGADAECERIDAERRELSARLAAALAPFRDGDGSELASAADVRAFVDRVAERARRWRAARDARSEAERRIERLEAQLDALSQERATVYTDVGLADGADGELDDCLRRHPGLAALRKELGEANGTRAAHAIDLSDDLRRTEPAELERANEEAARMAAERDDLLQSIAETEHEIRTAMGGHVVEECLAEHDAALAELRGEFDRACAAAVGDALVGAVRSIEGERSRPAVLRRADALLASFTNGLLNLCVTERDGEPEFRVGRGAHDRRPVDRLSRGECIQTLIAVRLAFLEQEESAVLPLLLDETLATSDDDRTATIIDTVIEIARGGRQVFCFTAQRDEVAKWRSRLDAANGVDFRHIDLDEVRGRARAEAFPPRLDAPPNPTVPEPADGENRAAYGARLRDAGRLTAIDPRDESQERLHLWHLVDEARQLHGLLGAGVSTWGQVRTLTGSRSSFLGTLGLDTASIATLEARARSVERACSLWRQGRGAPVGRDVLSEARGVSPALLDDVVAVAAECGGDAARLVEVLRERPLGNGRRLQSRQLEQLREWLTEHDYLDESPRLPSDDLRLRLLAECDPDLASGTVTTEFVDRTIAALPE